MVGLRAVVSFPVNGTKGRWLRKFAAKTGAKFTVAIGDGANDIPMFKAANIGIGFRPKPAAAEAADYIVTERDMRKILDLVNKEVENVRPKTVQGKP